MSPDATVGGDERLRLFIAVQVPESVADSLREWGSNELVRGRRVDTFHVTLAFLGPQPREALPSIVDAMRREARATRPFTLVPERYRETRTVGMVVLADPSGEATGLAERLQARLERLGVYARERRPWLPHVTVLRFRERPRLEPARLAIGAFAPSGVAAFLSRLHPSGARYEVLEACSLGNGG